MRITWEDLYGTQVNLLISFVKRQTNNIVYTCVKLEPPPPGRNYIGQIVSCRAQNVSYCKFSDSKKWPK